MTSRSLIVGLGSPHGDDQAGWLVVARLHDRGVSWESARTAKSPSELWDWCRKESALIVCDASIDDNPVGSVRRWTWPEDCFPARYGGTHDLPLVEALALGVELGCIPDRVTVWTIAGGQFQSGFDPSAAVTAAVETLANQLWQDFQRA